MKDLDAFSIRRLGTTGHEILGPDGRAIAWAVDAGWAALIVALLSRAETERLWGVLVRWDIPSRAGWHLGEKTAAETEEDVSRRKAEPKTVV